MLYSFLKFFRTRKQDTAKILKYQDGKRYYKEFHEVRKAAIDVDALKVVHRLQHFGYKAYVVGGCIRDIILKRRPKDFDIVSDAHPSEIQKIFSNSRIIGRRFKIVHIIFKGNKIIEVSTARSLPKSRILAKNKSDLYLHKDNQYGTFQQDAARRDFTINALFFDTRNETIIDYTGGFEDIRERMIRVIGYPNISLPEDPVRMLRAVKFAGILDFEIDSSLAKAIRKYKKYIRRSSVSRLHEEFNKIFWTGKSYSFFKKMIETGLFEALFPKTYKMLLKEKLNLKVSFPDTLLGRKLALADQMIAEQEDMNTTIYYSILVADFIKNDLKAEISEKEKLDERKIKEKITYIGKEFGLTYNEIERITKIYLVQKKFLEENNNSKGWIKKFKDKIYFPEAFILYKISARANQDEEAVKKALFWEIGLRKKLPNAIRMNQSYSMTRQRKKYREDRRGIRSRR